MLESTVELLGGLCLSALTVLMSVCIVGSIVAALRAVSRESAEITLSDEGNPPYSTKAKHNGGNGLWPKESARIGESCAMRRLERKIPMSF